MQLCGSLSILWHCLYLGLEWKLTCEALSPSVTVFGDEAFKEVTEVKRGHKGGALILLRRGRGTWELFPPPLTWVRGSQRKGHVRTQQEGGCLQARKTGLTRNPELGLTASRSFRNKFLLLRPPACGMFWWLPKQTKTTGTSRRADHPTPIWGRPFLSLRAPKPCSPFLLVSARHHCPQEKTPSWSLGGWVTQNHWLFLECPFLS